MDRHWDQILRCGVAGSVPIGGKLFAEINLPFTKNQYKNDNTVNCVYYRKTRLQE